MSITPAAEGFRFWLGTHETHWLNTAGFPLFISRRSSPAVACACGERFRKPSARGHWIPAAIWR